MEIYIITFKHGNYAVAAYNKLSGYGLKNIRLMQTPFSIISECDLCIKAFSREALEIILRECQGKYPVNNVYSVINNNGSYLYKLFS
ncbi:MAG: DUF3343 domain-containing protein [Sedimentibacter sp.]